MRPTTKADNTKATVVATSLDIQTENPVAVRRLLVESLCQKVSKGFALSRGVLRMRYQGTANAGAMHSFGEFIVSKFLNRTGKLRRKVRVGDLTFAIFGGARLNYEVVFDLVGPTGELKKLEHQSKAEPIAYDTSGRFFADFELLPVGTAQLLNIYYEIVGDFSNVVRACEKMESIMYDTTSSGDGQPIEAYHASIVRLYCKPQKVYDESPHRGYYIHAVVALPVEHSSHFQAEVFRLLERLYPDHLEVTHGVEQLSSLQSFPARIRRKLA